LTPFGFLDKKAMQLKTAELLHALGVAIDPDTKVASLKVGQQQMWKLQRHC
jgi:ribose transport system ATP-binding protein